jgi:hypothetical protein
MEGQTFQDRYLTAETFLNELTESLGLSETIDVKRQLFEWIAFTNSLAPFVWSGWRFSRAREDGKNRTIRISPDSVMLVYSLNVEITGLV